jgi:hypothetical protein
LQKKIISQEFPEVKNQREKNYLREALDSAQFHRMRKIDYLALDAVEKLSKY